MATKTITVTTCDVCGKEAAVEFYGVEFKEYESKESCQLKEEPCNSTETVSECCAKCAERAEKIASKCFTITRRKTTNDVAGEPT